MCDLIVRDALRRAIVFVRQRRPFMQDAFVLMPDHLHCIWTLPEGDVDFSTRWMMIKRAVSMECQGAYPREERSASRRKHRDSVIWQRRFWEHQIRNDTDFERHADYIHYNPVHHRLARHPGEWAYSSFHRFVKEGKYPLDWTCPATTVDLDMD